MLLLIQRSTPVALLCCVALMLQISGLLSLPLSTTPGRSTAPPPVSTVAMLTTTVVSSGVSTATDVVSNPMDRLPPPSDSTPGDTAEHLSSIPSPVPLRGNRQEPTSAPAGSRGSTPASKASEGPNQIIAIVVVLLGAVLLISVTICVYRIRKKRHKDSSKARGHRLSNPTDGGTELQVKSPRGDTGAGGVEGLAADDETTATDPQSRKASSAASKLTISGSNTGSPAEVSRGQQLSVNSNSPSVHFGFSHEGMTEITTSERTHSSINSASAQHNSTNSASQQPSSLGVMTTTTDHYDGSASTKTEQSRHSGGSKRKAAREILGVQAPIKFMKGEMIGAGGFGRVYQGIDESTGAVLAAKEIAFGGSATWERQMIALKREIAVMKQLDHPNVIKYYGGEKIGLNFYIYMEHLAGGSIASLIEQHGALSLGMTRDFISQTLEGLAHIHDNGLVHRDMKGGNALVGNDGTVKIIDFGETRHFSTVTGISGTPCWMAPEVLRGEVGTSAADIWSIGCMVMEMLTGRPPWAHIVKNGSVTATIVAIVQGRDALPNLRSPVATEFVSLCLSQDPTSRPSAESLLRHPFCDLTVDLQEDDSPGQQWEATVPQLVNGDPAPVLTGVDNTAHLPEADGSGPDAQLSDIAVGEEDYDRLDISDGSDSEGVADATY